MADPRSVAGIGAFRRDAARNGRRLRQLEAPDGRQTSMSATQSVNAPSVQADIFLGGSFQGSSCTVSGPVTGSYGVFATGIRSTGVRTTTLTNNPVQLYVDADGNLGVGASTKAKKNIGAEYNVDMDKFLAIVLKNWAYKDNPFATGMGPIADELDAAGLTEFVIYNLDGSIQGVRSDMLIIGLWSAYKQSRTNTLAEFAKRMVQTVTNGAMTLLGINAEKTYPIVWPKEFADTNYAVSASVTSSGLALAAVCAVVPGSKTTKGCNVTVRSLGIAIAANSTLTVEAIHV
jgi:hypothetical protein